MVVYVLGNSENLEDAMDSDTKNSLAKKGIIWIDGEVNSGMFEFVKGILGHHINIGLDSGVYPDLRFMISSSGGSLEFGLAIHDNIVAYPGKTVTIVMRQASSAASTILQAGKVRWAMPGTRILFHNPIISGVKFDSLTDKEEWEKLRMELLRDKERLHNTLTRLNVGGSDKLDGLCREDRAMFPEEAKRINAIDEIVTDPYERKIEKV